VTLRGLLFDLDDTLIPERPAIDAGFAAVASEVWGSDSEARIRSLDASSRAVWDAQAPERDYLERVHIGRSDGLHGDLAGSGAEAETVRAFVPRFQAQAFEAVLPQPLRGCSASLVDRWRQARLAALTVYPETAEVLDFFLPRLPLALVSNGPSRLQRLKLSRTGLERYFTAVVVSEDVGVGKPSAAMFQAALDGLGLTHSEVIMVGNDRKRDVDGARSAGINAVWVNRDTPDADSIADLRFLQARFELAGA
jgi:putative hydrolase of the HAD superfamily